MAQLGTGIQGSFLHVLDVVVLVVYFAILLFVGLYISKKNRQGSINDYFLASRTMHWVPVGASLFASCIGSRHFIGLAGTGASSGMAVAIFELGAIFILIMLGWFFVPVYISSGVYTMPEYLKERFGGRRIQLYLSFLSLLLYIFTKISAELYAGALFIQMALNKTSQQWLYISILILLGLSALFTIAGGLTAVMWTDLLQTILMIGGATILAGIAFNKVGGLNGIIYEFPYAVAEILPNSSCGIPQSNYLNIFRTIEPGATDFPWTGVIFGLAINSTWYWCTDQVIVQRALAARSIYHAKSGTVFASYLKMLPVWILILPGMAARILLPNRIGCADPDECYEVCGSRVGCTNIAYIELVLKIMPVGLSGMMLAVMLAALMSSLTSIFNSASTIFTIDIWTRIRKKPSEVELLVVGRIFIIFLVVVSVFWVPVIQDSSNAELFNYAQSVTAFLAPPICAVFVLAIFCERVNEPGAFCSLMVGLFIGMIRFSLEFSYPRPPCGIVDTRPDFVKIFVGRIHYLHFSCILFLISIVVCLAVSFSTKPIPKNSLYRLTYWTRHNPEVRVKMESNKNLRKRTKANEKESDVSPMEHQSGQRQSKNSAMLKSLIRIFAGAAKEKQETEIISEKEKARLAAAFMEEEPFWKKVANINAVICLTITCFTIGFFA